MEGLSQSTAGVLLVQFGPKECQQRVAAVKAAGGGDGEVAQQGGLLRGRRDHAKLMPLGIVEVQPPERPKFDHGNR